MYKHADEGPQALLAVARPARKGLIEHVKEHLARKRFTEQQRGHMPGRRQQVSNLRMSLMTAIHKHQVLFERLRVRTKAACQSNDYTPALDVDAAVLAQPLSL